MAGRSCLVFDLQESVIGLGDTARGGEVLFCGEHRERFHATFRRCSLCNLVLGCGRAVPLSHGLASHNMPNCYVRTHEEQIDKRGRGRYRSANSQLTSYTIAFHSMFSSTKSMLRVRGQRWELRLLAGTFGVPNHCSTRALDRKDNHRQNTPQHVMFWSLRIV